MFAGIGPRHGIDDHLVGEFGIAGAEIGEVCFLGGVGLLAVSESGSKTEDRSRLIDVPIANLGTEFRSTFLPLL